MYNRNVRPTRDSVYLTYISKGISKKKTGINWIAVDAGTWRVGRTKVNEPVFDDPDKKWKNEIKHISIPYNN